MAEPIAFPESNQTWVGPPGSTDVGDLQTLTENGVVLSCWQLSEEELEYVRMHGKVWLTVWGRQPPVNVTAVDPFDGQEEHDPQADMLDGIP